jgi:hypothetical protein
MKGGERVSVDRKDMERLLQIANDRGWDWNLDAPDGDHATILRVQAALTAAPPERHDAPGVSRDDAEEMLDLYDTAPNKEYLTKYRELIINALTGQPDAGRDPDAAGAGGE